ncbi:MAG: hypothetical protein HC887_01385 [Desulfobacteraceae bacterium]|nr:hypothetical protein [Desulfobacteraceae bacterium]
MVWTILLQQDALKKQGEALKIQIDALDEQIKMFKRQGLIELHHIWTNTSDIDLDNIVVPDVIQIVNALTLTASVWNHDVIEKEIIFQNYWTLFKEHYETLHSDKILPGKNRKCRSFLTPDISKAYSAMKKKEEDLVKTSSVGSN